LSVKLEAAGHAVSPPTVGRLLRKLDYSLHVNAKKIAVGAPPDRVAGTTASTYGSVHSACPRF
jgi:hypothetical protein